MDNEQIALAQQIEARRLGLIDEWLLTQLQITKEQFSKEYVKLRDITIETNHVSPNLSIYKLFRKGKQKGLTMFLFSEIIEKDGKQEVILRSQYIDESKK